MKLVFAGTPEFAVVALDALGRAGHEITLVLTQPDRPAGRGREPQPTPVHALALARGLPVARPAMLDDAAIALIAAARPEVMAVAAYGLLLPPALLELPPLGCVNIHASLLPRWRGAAPIQRALLAGDTHTGVTIMRMDAGLDTGPVLLREAIPIVADDTAGTLHDKLAALGAALIVRVLAAMPPARPQEASGATYARKLSREETSIDWNRPAAEIERQVRAFDPQPGARTLLAGGLVKICSARLARGTAGTPGTVITAGPSGILVACGQDGLLVTALQRAGGRRLGAAEYLAGHRIGAGTRLGAADG
ncbi:MAG: methionyl-tRNA formyltransferase [Burkholderiales bacterium]|nr:methionyl-tRNA formyltransferase [Burkholderiales bacterium]